MGVSDAQNWDIESLYSGGFEGDAWSTGMAKVEAAAASIVGAADALGAPGDDPAWETVLPALDALSEKAGGLQAYTYCVTSDDTASGPGNKAMARLAGVWSKLERAWTRPEQVIARADDPTFETLCALPGLANQRPRFLDIRASRPLLLPPGEAELVAELSEPSLGSWSRLYDKISGNLRCTVGDKELSVGQAFNLLDDASRETREAGFDGLEAAWLTAVDDCAEILGNLTKTRAVIAARSGVEPIDHPRVGHRLERSTLDAMIAFCGTDARPLMHRYMAAKAKALGVEKIDWFDIRAPVGGAERAWTWGSAQDFIVAQLGTFSDEMAAFATRAFRDRWVEAEDRPGKRQGAFCIPFRPQHQSRIFMTWSDTTTNLITLAHELGHAWHNEVMWDLPPARNRVPSTLAESASTFAEAVVRGAAMEAARGDDAAELAMLERELQAAAVMLVNIPTRMLLELSLYDQRAKGPLDPATLAETIESLQREWYGPVLGRAHPTFWAAKLHFFLSRPFYNYPYTFGYLFSSLIHAKAVAEGPAWASGYTALLRDTGAGPCEDVAQKHLGVDLRRPDAWAPVLIDLEKKVARYEALVG